MRMGGFKARRVKGRKGKREAAENVQTFESMDFARLRNSLQGRERHSAMSEGGSLSNA